MPQRRDGGMILHTVDGGDYWQIQAQTHQRGIGVHFSNAQSVWVVMEDGSSLLTTDGGVTWKQTPRIDLGIRLHTVKFRNHTEAWGLTGGTIFTTQNRGKSWETVRFSLGTGAVDAEAQSWIEKMIDERPFDFMTQITNAHFLADGKGWAVGGVLIQEGNSDGKDVDSLNKTQASGGQIYNTTDEGETWHHQFGESLDDLHDVLFLDEQHGWVVGDNGALFSTEDGGESWKRLKSGTTQRIVDVHFVSRDPKWGWAMLRDGTLLYTVDGEDWSTNLQEGLASDTPDKQKLPPDSAFFHKRCCLWDVF